MKFWVHGLCFVSLLGTASCAAPSDEGTEEEAAYTEESTADDEAQALLGTSRLKRPRLRERFSWWAARHHRSRRPQQDDGSRGRDDDRCDDESEEENEPTDEPTFPNEPRGDDTQGSSDRAGPSGDPTTPSTPRGPTTVPTTPTEPTTPTGPTVTTEPRTPEAPTVSDGPTITGEPSTPTAPPTAPTKPTVTTEPRTPETPAAPCTTLTYENFGRAFMAQYCISCHSGPAGLGGVDVSALAPIASRKREIDAHAVKTPMSKPMPPVGMPQPTAAERTQLGEWLSCGPN